MRIYEFSCEECGKKTTATRRDKRFCSTSCTRKAWYRQSKSIPAAAARANKTCPQCGTVFTPKRSDTVYCSTECNQKGYYQENKEMLHARGRAWIEANPGKRKEILTRFAERHPDNNKQRYIRLKADPERYAAYQERWHQYYLDHRDETIERSRKQRERFPTRYYSSRHDCDWDEMFAGFWHLQDGKCYLCGDPLDRTKYRGIHLDHDHSCCPLGRSCEKCRRGLSCQECNKLIGLAKDNPERLRRIADNLEVANTLVQERITGRTA